MPLEKFDDLVILKNIKQTAVTNNDIVTAVCFMFLIKLKWPKSKNIYDIGHSHSCHFLVFVTEPTQNYCQILVKCSWLVCQHLEFANGTLGAMINEFAFEF